MANSFYSDWAEIFEAVVGKPKMEIPLEQGDDGVWKKPEEPEWVGYSTVYKWVYVDEMSTWPPENIVDVAHRPAKKALESGEH